MPASPPAAQSIAWNGAIIVVGGALGVLGSFLPWITATAVFVGTFTRNGLDGGGDGVVTIVAGVVAALAGVALLARSRSAATARLLAILAGVALVGIAVVDLGTINERVSSITSDVGIASVGMGIYTVILGGVLSVLGGLMSHK